MDQSDAKARSEDYLNAHGVAVNEHLPFIESVTELNPRTSFEVAARALVLHHMAFLGFGGTPQEIKELLGKRGLLEFASAAESELINQDALERQQQINCSWLPECLQSLGYCLGMVRVDPFKHCDDDLANHFPLGDGQREAFLEGAALRPFDDIYQQCDLHYRLHWAAREARLRGTDCPVQEGLIAERRKAIDWAIGVERDWDDIPLDT